MTVGVSIFFRNASSQLAEHSLGNAEIEILIFICFQIYIYVKIKWSRYRSGVAQRVGRGIALLFHDRGTGRGCVVSSTPLPHFIPGKDPVPTLQEAGWATGPVWTGGKYRPHWDSMPDRPARSQSLYRLNYPAHSVKIHSLYKRHLHKLITGHSKVCTGSSKKMDGIWNRYNLKSTGRIYTFGVLKCSETFKVLDLL